MRYVLALVAVVGVSGCGGTSEPQFTRERVEESMTQVHREQLKRGATMDQLECIMDGDEFHWRCFGPVRDSGQLYTLTTEVTCDAETGRCLSEPQSLDPA